MKVPHRLEHRGKFVLYYLKDEDMNKGDFMKAYKINARIGPDRQLTFLEPLPPLSEGRVEVIVVCTQEKEGGSKLSATAWPILDGGRFLGGKLSRGDIYDDAR